ncbi:DNA recombination protein RmuC [Robiginitalea aurantiaca]|uniref:DNA recombination protein RmuC n=1 Tax=Robiginitalea aurantiaca TaxID=3056915 RepID=A0ABT7WCC6_9FLAO|nr:DNA recombination protein RmuC [Robiginitalea aurantiaca]MDM9630565.1 DNA recombination protein RmuC [Robiginitalea aurantiaca]
MELTTNFWLLLLGMISVLGIGFFLGGYILRLKLRAEQSAAEARQEQLGKNLEQLGIELVSIKEDRRQLHLEKEHLGQELIRRESEVAQLREKQAEQKKEILQLQDTFTKEFENLANKILEEKSSKFTEQNQKNIRNILTPLHDKIQLFEKKVEETRKENYGIHQALKEQLMTLQNQNLKITREAENLTRALKGESKMQGNWGELVLERVLEKSGLEKDREYSVQQSFRREDGSRSLPDVIIHLPNGNKMVVDSKVSLTHYERYVNGEETEQDTYLKEHLNSLKRHVEQLSAKKYEDLYEMESPDFVLMFVPIETAFTIAINTEPDLYNKAFEHNIVIVTPSTLLATLRTIDSMWSNEKQRRNAIEIARQAGALYDKFEGLVTDLTQVGKRMDEAKNEYSGAMNKLVTGRGNIIGRIEKLKKMGAKTKKSLPETILKRAEEANISGPEELDLH